jgi:MFS family permease
MNSTVGDPLRLHGIRANPVQFSHQLLQVLFVGLTLGMTRTVVPALAESEFGVPRDSFVLLTAFVVAFGFVKGLMNFVAGRLSDRIGRRRVLLIGWLVALPIPALIQWGPSWNWIVAATVLLGINQGLTWSMTQTAKLDMTRADQRGLVIGLNEFAGYVGVALAGVATGYLAGAFGPRAGVAGFGAVVVLSALALTWLCVQDTRAWLPPTSPGAAGSLTTREVFAQVSWRDKRLMAISQAGLVEKFVDALVWVFYPVFLYRQGLNLAQVGWVVSAYGLVWGVAQLVTGKLSDKVGRYAPNVAGMLICGTGVALMPLADGLVWWTAASALSGLGMALLYPNLSAAVADIAEPAWRGSAIGIYRFWRDLGYGIGALGLGLAASVTGSLESGFWFVAASMLASAIVLALFCSETRPQDRARAA